MGSIVLHTKDLKHLLHGDTIEVAYEVFPPEDAVSVHVRLCPEVLREIEAILKRRGVSDEILSHWFSTPI